MDTNGHELVFKNEVFQLVGSAFEVLNQLGHGFLEKPYEKALLVEFGLKDIPFRQQPRFNAAVILNFKNPKLEWERIVL